MRLIIVACLLLACFGDVCGMKFLIYNPKLSKSLVGFMNKLGDVLVEGGHEVVHYMPELDATFGNSSNSKNGRIIERKCDFLDMPQEMQMSELEADAWTEGSSAWDMYTRMKMMAELYHTSCTKQLQDTKLMDMLRAEKFDLGFVDFFDVCGFGIFEKIGVKKHIAMYSAYLLASHASVLGIPATPSYVPELQPPGGDPIKGLTFFQRLTNQLNFFAAGPMFDTPMLLRTADAFKENGVNVGYHELMGRSSYFFINTDEHIDFPRPISHKTINVGGIRMAKAMQSLGKLDKKIQHIFDTAQDGVIFVSFGSIANSCQMPNETKRAFLEAFSQFPRIQFLWKYERPEDSIVQGISNLHVSKWWPQKEIFAQEKLLAFVSHSGMNSVSEATYSGVPIICIPLFGDQPRNAMMMESRGVGLVLNKYHLTSDSLVKAIRKIINDKTFKQNALSLSKMIHQKPMSPDERVLKYSEHAVRFDVHTNLDLPGRHLNTIHFYNIDVWAFILSIGSVLVFLMYKVLKYVLIVFLFGQGRRDGKKKKE